MGEQRDNTQTRRYSSQSRSRSHSPAKRSKDSRKYDNSRTHHRNEDNNRKNNHRRNDHSRSRSHSRDNEDNRRSSRQNHQNYRFSREEMKEKRINDRNQLRLRKSIWDYSTDEEDYEEDVAMFWQRQEKERARMEQEQKEKEERRRLRKIRRIQRKANDGGDSEDVDDETDSAKSSDEEDDDERNDSGLSSRSGSNDSSDLDSDGGKGRKKNKSKKQQSKNKKNGAKKNQGSDDSQDEDNSSGFDSDDSFAELCREKINGPDPKKLKKQQKAQLARKKALLAQIASGEAAANANGGDNVDAGGENIYGDLEDEMNSEKDEADAAFKDFDEEEDNNVEKYLFDTMVPVGPMPLMLMENKRDMNYTGLMPGEGDAIAQYVEEGKRIPRRGEVGLSSEQIQRFEDLGYVMSGSRHKRMNAVRQMKEAKVISQQEKKAMAIYNYQQKNKTETKLDAYFKSMLEEKLEENKRKNNKI